MPIIQSTSNSKYHVWEIKQTTKEIQIKNLHFGIVI